MKMYTIFLNILFLTAPVCAAELSDTPKTDSAVAVAQSKTVRYVSPHIIRKVLYSTVALCAAYSFLSWLPQLKILIWMIQRNGILRTMSLTHMPQRALNLATIAACMTAFIYDSDDKG